MTGLLVGTGSGLWQDGRRLAEGRVVDVATAPAGGWVAVVDGRVVTSDGAPAVPVPGPAATCVAALGTAAVVGTAEAHLVIVDGGQARRLESFDSAEGRDRWYTPWGGPPDTRSLAVGGDGALWVNVHVGGIVRSSDGGATWRPTIDVDADVHQVVVVGDRVVAATARGLATSADQGATWAFATEGLHGAYARAVAVAGEWLLLSASTGPYTDRSAVYRRPLAAPEGVPFERCSPWFTENIDTGLLAAAGDGTSAALAAPDGALYRSADAGASWEPAPGPPAPVTALAFA